MQFSDDEHILTVSIDTNRDLILKLETTIVELQSALNGTIAGVLKDIVVTLHRMGYCCCGQDRGKPIMATFCPKHGVTVLNSGGSLEYPLDDAHAHVHFLATGCSCRQSAGDSPTCHVHHPSPEKPQPSE